MNKAMEFVNRFNKRCKNRKIEKYTGVEANSFNDLRFNHIVDDEFYKNDSRNEFIKKSTVPVYTVNKITGTMRNHKAEYVRIIFARGLDIPDKFCGIEVLSEVNTKFYATSFYIQEKDQHNSSHLTTGKCNGYWDMCSGNYAIFLHQKDAAQFARDIIWKEKVEIDGRINMLEELINV